MSPEDSHVGAGTPDATGAFRGADWLARLETGMNQLIYEGHVASPDEVPDLVAKAAAMFDAQDAVIYLADLQQRVLVPFQGPSSHHHGESHHVLGVDATVAGRAFQQMHQVSQSASPRGSGDRTRIWLPLLNGTERLGVLGMLLPAAVLDDGAARHLQRFASVVAELVMTKALYGDSIIRTRRTTRMALAAEVQWSLLPPLTFANHLVTVAGGLEPAYEVAGDSLDYAVDAGMGHGIVSAQLISLVVAAYRNARRAGQTLAETAVHIESAVNDVFRVESFATGLLCELDTTNGMLTWISAGHHEPLLLRDGRLVRALVTEPLLPLGLNHGLAHSTRAPIGEAHLQPGDMLLLYTDGVIEARSPDGEFFGQERLVELVSRHLVSGLPAPEVMRRVVHALLDHQAGDLDDDATILLVEWHGPPGPNDDPPPLSVTGKRALNPEASHVIGSTPPLPLHNQHRKNDGAETGAGTGAETT
jgi:hypothetical protein